MTRFCTACGARSEDQAGFCEECGNALRPVAPPQRRRSWLLPAALAVVALIVAVGGFAWWSTPRAASAGALPSARRDASGASATVVDRGPLRPAVVPAGRREQNPGTTSAPQNGIFAAMKNLVRARKTLDGTYADSLGAITFTFKDDGTMLASMMRHEVQCGCSYEVDGDTVKLLTPAGGVLVLTLLQNGSLKGVDMPGFPPGMIFTKQQGASGGGRDAGGKSAAGGTGVVAANLSGVEAEAKDAARAEIARHWSRGQDGWTTALIEGEEFHDPMYYQRFLRQFREMTVESVEPIEVSAADRLNGFDWIGIVSIRTGTCREAGDSGQAFSSLGMLYRTGINRHRGQWTQWVDVHSQPLDVSKVNGVWRVQEGRLNLRSGETVGKLKREDVVGEVLAEHVSVLRGKRPTYEDVVHAGCDLGPPSFTVNCKG
jgi:hypothetical protein